MISQNWCTNNSIYVLFTKNWWGILKKTYGKCSHILASRNQKQKEHALQSLNFYLKWEHKPGRNKVILVLAHFKWYILNQNYNILVWRIINLCNKTEFASTCTTLKQIGSYSFLRKRPILLRRETRLEIQ